MAFPPNMARRAAAALAAAALAGGAGCASGPRSPAPASAVSDPPLVWPAPPDPARIAFVRQVHRPDELGARLPALTRLGHWVSGSNQGDEPFEQPFGLAVDQDDNLCLTDTAARTVCFYDRAAARWHRWGVIGGIRLASPVAVAHHRGVFYVADTGLGRVLAFDGEARLLRSITNRLERPSGLAVLQDQLYVADSLRHEIDVFDLDGRLRQSFGHRGDEPGEFNHPTHLAAGPGGELLVTDSMNCRVQIFTADGKYQGAVGGIGDSPGCLGRPKGVAVDSHGHVYVLDASFDNLQIFNLEGRLLLNLGGPGADPGQFCLPNGIAVTRRDEILITDSYNHRLQILKYIGPP